MSETPGVDQSQSVYPQVEQPGTDQSAQKSSPGHYSPTRTESIFYGSEVQTVNPGSYDELREIVLEAGRSGTCLIPSGFGNHAYLGNLPTPIGDSLVSSPLVVSLRNLCKVLRYEPADFTIGVQAGTSLEKITQILAPSGQEIAVDYPNSPQGSIGGAVAGDRYGPRRGQLGSYRNRIIGMVGMLGDGTIYKAGGMVVKNVAGYDLAKVMVGSLGTLGFLLEINFKLYPLAQSSSAHIVTFSSLEKAWEFTRAFSRARLEPACLFLLDAPALRLLSGAIHLESDEAAWAVTWLFEGNTATIDYLKTSASTLIKDSAPIESHSLNNDQLSTCQDWLAALQQPENPQQEDLVILRLSTLPTTIPKLQTTLDSIFEKSAVKVESRGSDTFGGTTVLRLRGAPDALQEVLTRIRDALFLLQGTGRILFASPEVKNSNEYLIIADRNRKLAQRIQDVFDPKRIFNPGRVSVL